MKRSGPIKRKKAKPRARGTACMLGKRCIATVEYNRLGRDGYIKIWRLCDKHAADLMMGDAVKAEEMLCRRCGSTENLQWAHVLRRSYMAVRWERSNSMALCAGCHVYFTHRPLEWEQWCRDNGVPWDDLRIKALSGPPMQPVFVIERLKGAA